MSSIPLPALGIKPVEQADPLSQYAKFMAIKNAAGQQKMQAAQLTAANQENQQRQMQLDDQQKIRSVFADPSVDWTQPDALDQVVQKVRQAGVSPQTIMQMQNGILEQKQKLATLNKTQHEALQMQVDELYQAGKGIQALPAEQRPQAYQQAIQRLVQAGHLDPKTVPPEYPGDDAFNQLIGTLGISHNMVTAQARAQQAATGEQKAAAELPGLQATSAQKQIALAAQQLSNAKDEASYQAARDQLPFAVAKNFPDKFDRNAILRVGQTPEQQVQSDQGAQRIALDKQRTGMEARRLNLQFLQGGFTADGKPLTADNASPTAVQIAAGKLDPATARAMLRRQPGLYNQVLAVDPNFDEANIDRRFAFNRELTNYAPQHIGGQTLALNKLVHHADTLYGLVDAMQNGSFRPGNAMFNRVKTEFGATPVPNFNTVRDFVVGEAAKLAHGGVPNESDINRSIENMKHSSSPQQLKGQIQQLFAIAGGQMQTINEQGRKNGMGDNFSILGPEASQIVQKHGIDPNTLKPVQAGGNPGGTQQNTNQNATISVKAPNGKTYTFPNQQAADDFKRKAGIQ